MAGGGPPAGPVFIGSVLSLQDRVQDHVFQLEGVQLAPVAPIGQPVHLSPVNGDVPVLRHRRRVFPVPPVAVDTVHLPCPCLLKGPLALIRAVEILHESLSPRFSTHLN